MRLKAEGKFTPHNFNFLCAHLGMPSARGVTDALFESIDTEVEDVLTAQQVYEWIVTLFSPPTGVRDQPVSSLAPRGGSGGGAPTAVVSDAAAHAEQLAVYAYQFVDFGHAGRLRTRHIVRSMQEIFRDISRFDLPERLVSRVVRELLAPANGRGRPRQDSAVTDTGLGSVGQQVAATLDAVPEETVEQEEEGESDNNDVVESADGVESGTRSAQGDNQLGGEDNDATWKSVVLHPKPPRNDVDDQPLTKAT